MRKMSKKIIVSVLTLVLTVVALGTTTYAWFTVGGTVAVDPFEMQVTSGVGLEIAYLHSGMNEENGDLNWVKTINKEDLYTYLYVDYYLNGNLEDIDPNTTYSEAFYDRFKLDAFTSEDGVIIKSMSEDDLSLGTASKEEGYIQFSLAFRTKEQLDQNNELPLYLNDATFNSTGVDWKPEKLFTTVGGGSFGPTDSVRTFFAANGLRVSLNDDKNVGNTTIFEKATSGNDNTQLSNNEPNWAEGAHSYYQAITGIDLETTHSLYRAAETITGIGGSEMEIAQFVEGADGIYRYAVVTIRIYLEGFDSETFNAIFDDIITARFGFNLLFD